jgi:hypothetical protein
VTVTVKLKWAPDVRNAYSPFDPYNCPPSPEITDKDFFNCQENNPAPPEDNYNPGVDALCIVRTQATVEASCKDRGDEFYIPKGMKSVSKTFPVCCRAGYSGFDWVEPPAQATATPTPSATSTAAPTTAPTTAPASPMKTLSK